MFVDGKQKLVSRHTMEQHLGRALLTSELVHHRDGDPFNNTLENLQIVSRAEHKRIHAAIGESTRLKKRWQFDVEAIVRRYERESATEIAKSLGCSSKTIERLIRDRLALKSLRGSKTTCHRGHSEFVTLASGRRSCRACHREYQRQHLQRKTA
jgi:hypothetical protein